MTWGLRIRRDFLTNEEIKKIKDSCWFYIRSKIDNGRPILCLRRDDKAMIGPQNSSCKDDATIFLCKMSDITEEEFEVSYSVSDWFLKGFEVA